ncbi:MAG: rubredoxin [Lachnospiraceae bacterium]|nr:rubredoxin [Lachnospiraceae bacterium]
MEKYICSICGYAYSEDQGIPEAGILPGTKWEELPHDWVCPLCGASKEEFKKQNDSIAPVDAKSVIDKRVQSNNKVDEIKELSLVEMSALCSNLARGCEKQYMQKESTLFQQLASHFKSKSESVAEPKFSELMELIEKDLEKGFPNANLTANNDNDRGALRALVWSEKVTRILKSLILRYQKEGDAMIQNTGVYVCTICGFVYVGDFLPEVCPVCKVPNWKFEKIEGRNVL